MSKTRWADIEKGTTVVLKGREWTVDKVKVKGKVAKVTVSGSLGTFSREMKAKDKVEVVAAAERWATPKEAKRAEKAQREREKLHRPPRLPEAPKADVDWTEPEDKAEKRVRDILGGKMLAVEREGVYAMPPVTVDTIAAHLLAFHGVRYDGATLEEAKKLQATHTPEEATALVSWESMKELHDAEHLAIEQGQKRAVIDHVHTADRPAS